MKKEQTIYLKESYELKEQLKTLNENLRRETEVCNSRDKENMTISSENKMLKGILDDLKA